MSLNRTLAAVVAAIALAVIALIARSQSAPAPLGAPAARLDSTPMGIATFSAPSPRLPAAPGAARGAVPALPDAEPFGARDFVVTTDMPEGPLFTLRSASRVGRDLAVELAIREPLPEGKRLFATVSVSDGLGNTVMECTWRDVELAGAEPRKLECELPLDAELPLAISAHQLSAPSFIENPTVVAVDKEVH